MAFSCNHFISGCAWFRTADRFGTPQLPKRTSERRLVSLPTSTPQPFLETWRCQFTRFDQPGTYLRHCALASPQVANPGLEAAPALGPVALLHLGSHMRNSGICYFHIITRTGLVFIHLLLRRFCQFASKWQHGIQCFHSSQNNSSTTPRGESTLTPLSHEAAWAPRSFVLPTLLISLCCQRREVHLEYIEKGLNMASKEAHINVLLS